MEQKMCGGLGGLRLRGYCAGVKEDASLVEDYSSVCSKECARMLTIAYLFQGLPDDTQDP
jgi:hypothetical protein